MASDIARKEVTRLFRSGGGWTPGDMDLGRLRRPVCLLWALLGQASQLSSLSLLWPASEIFPDFFSKVILRSSPREASAEKACGWEIGLINSHGHPLPDPAFFGEFHRSAQHPSWVPKFSMDPRVSNHFQHWGSKALAAKSSSVFLPRETELSVPCPPFPEK